MDEQLLMALFQAILDGETGDSSSQLNVAQDFAGSMFDPALGLMASMGGDGAAFDWTQLFEYEDPGPAPQLAAARDTLDAALASDDENERFIAELIEAGASPERAKRELRDLLGYDPADDKSKSLADTVKLYDSFADRLHKEKTEFQVAEREYQSAMESYDPTPKLVENDMVQKFRKAGIPLPTERPNYTASDFSPGADERVARRDQLGSGVGDAQRQLHEMLRRETPMQAQAAGAEKLQDLFGRSGWSPDVMVQRASVPQIVDVEKSATKKLISEGTRQMNAAAPKSHNDYRQVIADLKGQGQAKARADQGRTPTTDALLSRLLAAGGV